MVLLPRRGFTASNMGSNHRLLTALLGAHRRQPVSAL